MLYRMIKGGRVPALGLGTYGLTGPEGERAVAAALEAGYRHIDTAQAYGNEREVGRAIAAAGVDRAELFVTTKIWYTDLADGTVQRKAAESLDRLGLDHVDLLLVHWPNPAIPLGETLAAFAAVKAAGLTRHIGVSNFTTALLRAALEEHGADLFADQVEYHPFLDQRKVLAATRAAGMLLTAYSPLARGTVGRDPVLRSIADAHGRTPEQVALRWLLGQDGVAAIPKSARPETIRSNLQVFDFELPPEHMAAIDARRGGRREIDPSFAPAWDTQE